MKDGSTVKGVMSVKTSMERKVVNEILRKLNQTRMQLKDYEIEQIES